MDSRQKKEVDFRSTQVGEHTRIRDKTQSAGDIVAVGVAHFYAALSLSGFAGRPHPTHRAPNPFDQPPLSFNCQLRCLFVSPRCRLNVAPGKSLGGAADRDGAWPKYKWSNSSGHMCDSLR